MHYAVFACTYYFMKKKKLSKPLQFTHRRDYRVHIKKINNKEKFKTKVVSCHMLFVYISDIRVIITPSAHIKKPVCNASPYNI